MQNQNQIPPSEAEWIQRALEGKIEALEYLLASVQDLIFNLSLQFLWYPDEAKDATQEILIKIMTNLKGFRMESSFKTWSVKIALNYLINYKKKYKVRAMYQSLDLAEHTHDTRPGIDQQLEKESLEQEIKVACTHAMLSSLEPNLRMAFILGCIFRMPGPLAAEILEISAGAFRKRLSRARLTLNSYLVQKCSLVQSGNACRCNAQAKKSYIVNKAEPYIRLAEQISVKDKRQYLHDWGDAMNHYEEWVEIFRQNPVYDCPEGILENIKALFQKPIYSN